jgi:hypothetical protein
MEISTIVVPNRKNSFSLTVPPDPSKNFNNLIKRKDSIHLTDPPESENLGSGDGL